MKKKKVYLFIPGYYGTTLIDKLSNRLIWGDAKELFFRRATLAMPIAGVNIPGARALNPHSVIPDMQILGGLIKEEAYGRTLKLLESIEAEAVIKIAWDWRADPIHGVRLLDQARKEAELKYPDCELILVAHSFGSLVASYYLRYGTQDYFDARETWEGLSFFKKVILSATPFRGLMAIFRNMHKGIRFGLNTKMQSALAFSTFESSYFLLPPQGLDRIQDEDGNSLSLGIHNPENWIKNRWGLFHEQLRLNTNDELKIYLTTNLLRANKFHQLNLAPMINRPLEKKNILYLQSFGFKTVHEGVWLKNHYRANIFLYYPKDFKKWKPNFKHDQIYGDGDLTVPDFSLHLPSAFLDLDPKIVKEKLGHLDILQHESSQKVIRQFLSCD
jgi:pimeloyl-ACP methyl ester carboxylesterase